MNDTAETTETEMAAEDTRCVLVYREMTEHSDGLYERGEAAVLGDEDRGHVEE